MIPFSQFRLTAEQLDHIKRKNQIHSVNCYIKKNGVEPNQETVDSFYMCTNEEMEKYRRLYYSVLCCDGGNGYADDSEGVDTDKNSSKYFTIYAFDNGEITWSLGEKTVQYSKNEDEWMFMNSGTTISVIGGDTVRFKGNNASYSGNTFACTTYFNVEGNIMSLLYDDRFEVCENLEDWAFSGLFNNCDRLKSARNLILPSLVLKDYCYSDMFHGCTSLTAAPKLPATTLADYCYNRMFTNCYSLVTAPELPATTLGNYCYYQMFGNCIRLAQAPALPATTLEIGCYSGMFASCKSLTTAPKLPAETLADYCYRRMFLACTSLTKAPELPAMTLTHSCYEYMFSRCTGLTSAPALPATTLSPVCYCGMFANCASLTNPPKLPATSLSGGTTPNGCYYAYGGMFSGCTSLTTAPELPATTLADNCYSQMFNGCTSLLNAPELPAIELRFYCYDSMFSGCTSLTTAPELPALTLENKCYIHMFDGCSNLSYIKANYVNIIQYSEETLDITSATSGWVNGVSANGTFVKNLCAKWNIVGVDGVPEGWEIQYSTQ